MRLLLTSDWHQDAVTLGVPRRAELRRYVDELEKVCQLEKVDAVVFPGDLNDPGGMLASRNAADGIEMLFSLAEVTRLGAAIAAAGNHDVVETSDVLTTLSPVAVADRVLSRPNGRGPRVFVAERPSFFVLGGDDDVGFLCLPYMARAALSSSELGSAEAAFNLARASDYRKIVTVSHLNVPGAGLGSETREMSRGRDVDLPSQAIRELDPVLVVNGHYHRPQVVGVDGLEVVIPGSPLAFTTDDEVGGKGYTLVDI